MCRDQIHVCPGECHRLTIWFRCYGRAVDDGLDKLIDSAWETDERQLAKVIQDGIRAAGNFIHKV